MVEVTVSEYLRLRARVAELEREREELRSSCAKIIGANPDWPQHGNVPLAIAASLQLAWNRNDELMRALRTTVPSYKE